MAGRLVPGELDELLEDAYAGDDTIDAGPLEVKCGGRDVPAGVQLGHEAVGRDADVFEEDLVEGVAASDVDKGGHLNARQAHVGNQVAYALVLRCVLVRTNQQDAPV